MTRQETDAIGKPINISKVIPKTKPWTKEEIEKARLKNIARANNKKG